MGDLMKKYIFLITFFIVFFLTGCNGAKEPNNDNNTNEPVVTYYNVVWKDSDGTIIGRTTEEKGTIPSFNLPSDTNMWDYTTWNPEVTAINSNKTYTANRVFKEDYIYDYFIGNVFQIITYDIEMNPISVGTGFVFDSEGYFITNYHVMEDGFFAEAIFDVTNSQSGESNVRLNIDFALYQDDKNDYFIGKIEDYPEYMSDYFNKIKFSTGYFVGDTTYSVGYPYSSVEMEVNKGEIVADISSLSDKVTDGVSYIGSTSFITPGSSGGVLINTDLEVIGLTTIDATNNDGFVLGGSVETFYFLSKTQNFLGYNLVDYALFKHPDQAMFVAEYMNLIENPNTEEIECGIDDDCDGLKALKLETIETGINSNGIQYSKTKTVSLYIENMRIVYESRVVFSDGNAQTSVIAGNVSNENIDDYYYSFIYQFADGRSSIIESYIRYYNEDPKLTLSSYYDNQNHDAIYTIGIIPEDLMRQEFNNHCEEFFEYFNIVK